MQKRPLQSYQIHYFPLTLKEDFPLVGGEIYPQEDKAITRLHYHNCFEVGYCHEGAGVFVIENKVLPFRKGCISVISRHERHLAQSVKGTTSKWSWLYFDPVRMLRGLANETRWLDTENFHGTDFPNMIYPSEGNPASEVLLTLIGELNQRKAGYVSSARGLILSLMVNLHRFYRSKAGKWKSPSKQNAMEKVSPALQCMSRMYDQKLDIRTLAKSCRMSDTHFRRTFTEVMGQSPGQYLINMRLKMAAGLLRQSTKSILDVSMEVGYPTLSSFNRHFRKYLHTSPREWRKREA